MEIGSSRVGSRASPSREYGGRSPQKLKHFDICEMIYFVHNFQLYDLGMGSHVTP